MTRLSRQCERSEACIPTLSYTRFSPESPAMTFASPRSYPACMSGALASDIAHAEPPGRS